ncbi:hypothetical protein VF21_03192 [Pseudogymnoascus sp. 05NY08]|nr:hypothetical protein VF21_03192 [Pseudogymnoascus sp. 05NY08]
MTNHLDLTLSPTRANMLLSPSNPPTRMTLRRAPPSFDHPLSATTSRSTFARLLASPPPSPSLPALVPRHGKPPPSPTPRRLRRLTRFLIWVFGVSTIVYYATALLRAHRHLPSMGSWSTDSGTSYELVGDDSLPDFPTPVVVTDSSGKPRWTISIPPHTAFPLLPNEYAELCAQTGEIATHVSSLLHKSAPPAAHKPYSHIDPNFLDPTLADRLGLLLSASQAAGLTYRPSRPPPPPLLGESFSSPSLPDCTRSLTVTLETPSAGLAPTLMLLWTAYGLALSEDRAFFIDDTRWSYGAYTDFFIPPPAASCRPPPRHHITPCPHSAAHLLVSSTTTPHTFGGAFHDAFEDAHRAGNARQKPIFDLARKGYEALFHLKPEDAKHVEERLGELRAMVAHPEAPGRIVGMHIRHGDAHPLSFQYRDAYIPTPHYLSAAHSLLSTSLPGPSSAAQRSRSLLIVASDDPDVYTDDDLTGTIRAQSVIKLASRPSLSSSQERGEPDARGMFRRFVEAPVGWEGGFFAGMFWGLGRGGAEGGEGWRLRGLVGRAYLLDLAVLAGAGGGKEEGAGIVCGVGSMGCKILAVMGGWEMLEGGGWSNVDGEFGWRGVSW